MGFRQKGQTGFLSIFLLQDKLLAKKVGILKLHPLSPLHP